jgi:hypothetical protein
MRATRISDTLDDVITVEILPGVTGGTIKSADVL